MKLEYKILWFDNDPEVFDSMEDEISGLKIRIHDWGFIPDIIMVSAPSEFMRYAPFDDIDLVVVDFNLEEHGAGQDFIAKLRDSSVYTEVIFYSAQGRDELWDALKERGLDGIYLANKELVIPRIEGVGAHTLRKILDLGNMRGIVMAEVGDLDLLLEEIFSLAMNDVPEDRKLSVYKKFHEHSIEGVSGQQQALSEFRDSPSVEQLLKLCDSSGRRWMNYNRIKKYHKTMQCYEVGDYQNEVITPRNALAHGIPKPTGDGVLRFNHHGTYFDFNEKSSRELRHMIIKYRNIFMQVRDALANKMQPQ